MWLACRTLPCCNALPSFHALRCIAKRTTHNTSQLCSFAHRYCVACRRSAAGDDEDADAAAELELEQEGDEEIDEVERAARRAAAARDRALKKALKVGGGCNAPVCFV